MNRFAREYLSIERKLDYRAAVIATVIKNTHRGKNQPIARLSDFFPSLRDTPRKREMSPDELKAAFLAAFGK